MQVLRDHHMIVIDDVEGSRKAVDAIQAAGATDLILQTQVGGLAHENVVNCMKLFMSEVAK
jgi:hypothetical protein